MAAVKADQHFKPVPLGQGSEIRGRADARKVVVEVVEVVLVVGGVGLANIEALVGVGAQLVELSILEVASMKADFTTEKVPPGTIAQPFMKIRCPGCSRRSMLQSARRGPSACMRAEDS